MTHIAEPTDLHPAWGDRFNAADVDGMLALAEPGSAFAPQPGVVATDDDYRSALEQFLQLRLPINLTPRRNIVVGDIALLLYDWTIKGTDPQGNDIDLSGTTADVARKGPDGWRFVIDNPFGTA
jgi:ketosteroid isomerase-like protein